MVVGPSIAALRLAGAGLAVTIGLLSTGCTAPEQPSEPLGGTPSASAATTPLTVSPPSQPLAGESGRFWYARPGPNRVAIGPYQATERRQVVRGACLGASRTMTWQILDNASAAEDASKVKELDHGFMVCDGKTHVAAADIGRHREIAVCILTDTAPEQDVAGSAWAVAANA